MVAAIRHPETAPRIERQCVRCPELSVSQADLAPGLDELPVGRELADPRCGAALEALGDGRVGGHPLAVVPVGDIDAAVRSDDNVVGLIELAVGVARLAGDAQAQKLLTLRTELVDLVPLGPGLVAREVRHPHVALTVHVNAMRRHHHTLAEVRQHRASCAIELEDRVHHVRLAVDTAACRPRRPRPRRSARKPRRVRRSGRYRYRPTYPISVPREADPSCGLPWVPGSAAARR